MKDDLIKKTNWIYGLIISLLGFSQGCSISGEGVNMYGVPAPEYGTPYAEFKISGRVTDINNNPIKNIEIDVKEVYHNDKKPQTDASGNYLLEYSSFPNNTIEVTYTDVDGVDNGGEFEKHIEIIEIKETDFTDENGNWYKGKVEKVRDTQLKLKDPQEK